MRASLIPAKSPVRVLLRASEKLCADLEPLRFSLPVTHVYNPLRYARASYETYIERFAAETKQVVFMGMNPGPYGMTQTGVPFGEVTHVRDWLGISAPVGRPTDEHPKRPVHGFACTRSEVSGARLWGMWKAQYGEPQRFFAWAFVANYCPLVFMDERGTNVTPDKLKRDEREKLLACCDTHLRTVIQTLSPQWVVGIGKFAEGRARSVLSGMPVRIGSMPHPSPASPAANRDWAKLALGELARQGVPLG